MIDMSPEAVTGRMIALDQLWELSVALKSSKIVEDEPDVPALPTSDPDPPEHREG